CRMAHLALPNSELHVGVSFEGHAKVEALAREPSIVVLFPGPGARDLAELTEPPQTLVVVDGTWVQARKVLERNPALSGLPRVRFTPRRPGNYRIRKEPAAHCVSTIEAVVEALGYLEGDPERFRPMLAAFDHMVDRQLSFARESGGTRHKKKRSRTPRIAVPRELFDRYQDLVAVYAEANAHAATTQMPGNAELVVLVAERLESRERFEAYIAPRRPLASGAPHHLEVSAERLLNGEPVAEAMARFASFLRPDDLLCSWGRYPIDLLAVERAPVHEVLDVRHVTARYLSRRPGGVERAAQHLGDPPRTPWSEGRAGRRLAALTTVLEQLCALSTQTLPPLPLGEGRGEGW
ncbi:MAG: DTW domain-containing protein, partial [Myxococcota bacterium]